ncbi:MFS transporter [Aeromicrobium sp. CTD01-1L150]|uniref:MFS transporter n=1 Tax=Aeromicrobium sp. CTD01-1L150 TaxID=3341830 RepID=UPI0035C1F80C
MSVSSRAVLSNAIYRRLFMAQVVALIGTGFLTVALSLLAYDVAPDKAGTVVATVLTIKMAAYVGIAPITTAVVSRFNPRSVLLGANLVRAAVAISLPWVDDVWQIYLLIFLLQSASATFTPAFQAVIPSVLPDERQYTRALALTRLAHDVESIISPMLSAALLLVISYHGLFVGTTVGFVLSAVLVVASQLDTPPRAAGRSFWARATDGARLFMSRPPLRALLALHVSVASGTALVLVNTVVVVRHSFGMAESAVAVTLGAYGAGSMIVALCVPRVLEHVRDRTVMLAGGILTPCGLVLAAAASSNERLWPALLLVWMFLGASASLVLTPSGLIVNQNVSEAERPAAFAAHFSLSHACFLLIYPLAGWAGARVGVPGSALILGTVAVFATVTAIILWTRVSRHNRQDVRPTPR